MSPRQHKSVLYPMNPQQNITHGSMQSGDSNGYGPPNYIRSPQNGGGNLQQTLEVTLGTPGRHQEMRSPMQRRSNSILNPAMVQGQEQDLGSPIKYQSSLKKKHQSIASPRQAHDEQMDAMGHF